jgi:hypothetical protein
MPAEITQEQAIELLRGSNQHGKFPDNSDSSVLMGRLEGNRCITLEGCWELLGTRNPKGYGMVSIDGYMYTVHRIMAELCLGLDRDNQDLHVRHSCDNPSCFNPDHLRIGTADDNVQDRFDRHKWGKIAKLNPEQIEQIKAEYASGRTQKDIATEYGVNQSTVSRIVGGQRWSRLKKGKVV